MENKSEKPERLVLIDANSLLHRAFHALPPLTSPSGELVGAVYGFASMLLKVIEELEPKYMAVAWDTHAPTFREQLYVEYKAHRAETDPSLVDQFGKARRVVEALNIPQYAIEGYEADDLIGTLSRQGEEVTDREIETVIVTGDHDMLQLVSPKTRAFIPRKGFSDTVLYDKEAVKERYCGLTPDQLVDYKALRGDPSDNIPGIKGVGEKTAIKLLVEYGNLEEVFRHTDNLSDKQKKLLQNGQESAYTSQKLARILRDAPLKLVLSEAEVSDFDHDRVLNLFREYGFRSLLSRLPDSGASSSAATNLSSGSTPAGQITRASEPGGSTREDSNAPYPERLVEQPRLIQDRAVVVDKELEDGEFDIYIAAYLLTGMTGKQLEFGNLVFHYLGEAVVDDQLSPEEVDQFRFRLKEKLKEELSQPENVKIRKLFNEVEMPLKKILEQMHTDGILVDRSLLTQLTDRYANDIGRLEKEIYDQIGYEVNLNSPKQLGEVLFDELRLPVIKKTKTQRSTDESVLQQLNGLHPMVETLLKYRERFKIKSTYLDPLPGLLDADGRVHTTYNQTKAASGRLSSENPNLQNIPVDPELGLRRLFIAPEGKKLVVADWSQIELRILAHVTDDLGLIASFENDQDIHSATAARIFNKLITDVTKMERKAAKTVNFALMYGMTAHGLSQTLGIEVPQADDYIRRFFEQYPGVGEWKEKFLAEARERGYVETLFGRRRPLPLLKSGNFHQRAAAERMAINHPIQGTQADLIKMAMINIEFRIQKSEFNSQTKMLLQVHDELVFEVEDMVIQDVAELVKDEMGKVMELKVPIEVDVKVGPNWQDTVGI